MYWPLGVGCTVDNLIACAGYCSSSTDRSTRSSAIAKGPRDASCQLKSCQLPRNSVETTCTTSPEQIEVSGGDPGKSGGQRTPTFLNGGSRIRL